MTKPLFIWRVDVKQGRRDEVGGEEAVRGRQEPDGDRAEDGPVEADGVEDAQDGDLSLMTVLERDCEPVPLGDSSLGGTTHGNVSDVWVDIGLPHGVRQPEPGDPRALLGLDAIEHLVSRSGASDPDSCGLRYGKCMHAPARALHL